MINLIKNHKLMSLILIIFVLISFVQQYTYLAQNNMNFSIYYIYAYTGLLIISFLFFTNNIIKKDSILLHVIVFLELHFITFLIILGPIILSIALMLISLLRYMCLNKGSKAAFTFTIMTIINYALSTLLVFFLGVSTIDLVVYIADNIAIILSGIFLYLATINYESSFQHLEESRTETTKSNQLLNNTIAELSTLQEISKFANSVLNTKELINIINDMIIGVIGVNYCSIFLINEKSGNIYLEATNIQDKNLLQNIKLNLVSKYMSQFKSRGLDIIEGSISENLDYPGAKNRDLKTYLITSLQSHRNFLGIVLVESSFAGVFEERKKNMLTTICNQVSIAIENAVIYDEMERLATIDGLTQVHNRRYFTEKCLVEFTNLSKLESVSIAMLDIDNFKRINDTYGHLAGDTVLKNVASIISTTTCASNSDNILVARYGGEEFVILMKSTSLSTAHGILEVVRKNIESCSVIEDGQQIKFTISIGLAEYPSTSKDVKEILKDADNALYKAKQTGKNKVVDADLLN